MPTYTSWWEITPTIITFLGFHPSKFWIQKNDCECLTKADTKNKHKFLSIIWVINLKRKFSKKIRVLDFTCTFSNLFHIKWSLNYTSKTPVTTIIYLTLFSSFASQFMLVFYVYMIWGRVREFTCLCVCWQRQNGHSSQGVWKWLSSKETHTFV